MKYIKIVFLAIFFLSCNNKVEKINNNKTTTNNNLSKTNIELIDNFSKFISGYDSEKLNEFQQKDFYKNYSKSIETNWNYFAVNQQLNLMNWAESHNLTQLTDTGTVFYPFAGPDFTFVYSFFPYAKNYILIGLENIGEVPDLTQYLDLELVEYLNSMTDALSEFFSQGYFSTLNLKYNFRKSTTNGVVHPLLFFIYRTEHQIVDMQYFTLDEFGYVNFVEKLEPLDKSVKGIRFDIKGKNGNKTIYYLQVDLCDQNFELHHELYTFISCFKEKMVFLKSASYLLQDDKLLKFKKLLINQASKIIQDDSGFSYDYLNKNNFDVSVFGQYSRTLNLFKEFWQPDLKAAFDSQKTNKLPFRFGYNVPFDETAIIFAQKKQSQKIEYPIFRVQFKTSWEMLPKDSFPMNFDEIDYYFDEGYYKYTFGNFKTKEECKNYLEIAKSKGYSDAFIIEFTKDGRKNH